MMNDETMLTHKDRPENPLWLTLEDHVPGVEENPLGYYCAPNAADAAYAGAMNLAEFIAYGFWVCWMDPGDFSLWWRMEAEDVKWLREAFLESLEYTLLDWYEHGDEWELPVRSFDSEYGENLNIGNSDEGEESEIMFTWIPSVFDPRPEPETANCLAWDLEFAVMADPDPKAIGGDPVTIYLDPSAIKSMCEVRATIHWARKMNGLQTRPANSPMEEAWEKVGAGSAVIEAPADCKDCFTFKEWWRKNKAIESDD